MVEIKRGKATQIRREIWFGAGQFAETHEFVGAKGIVIEELHTFFMQAFGRKNS